MLLNRLVEQGVRNATSKPFHREGRFDWALYLDLDGVPEDETLERLSQPDARGRLQGVPHWVPSIVKSSGIAPMLAADEAQYILGWSDPDSKPDRVAQCHRAAAELHQRWLDSPAGRADQVARAMAAFFRDGHAEKVIRPEDCGAKASVLVFVDGAPAYRAPSASAFWTSEVAARKGGGAEGLCLVCGEAGPLLKTVPAMVPSRLVPGASQSAALVSINAPVFGYDLVTGLVNTPICMTCGNSMAVGLSAVLGSDDTTTEFTGQDSRMSWWYTADVPAGSDPMGQAHDPDPIAVRTLLKTVRTGDRLADPPDLSVFCSLTVGGNIARIVVRDWVEMPLKALRVRVAAWFDDTAISSRFDDGDQYHGLAQLIRVTGRWLRDRGRYAEPGAKGADRPDGVQRDLMGAVIHQRPIPLSLVAHLVNRVRTDGRLDAPRAALLRVALIRHPNRLTERRLMPGLDLTHTDPAYVAGRIFAQLEDIQQTTARRTDTSLNATYADRYFSGAVGNPAAALVNGRRDAQAWLSKLRRRKDTVGLAVLLGNRLDETFALLEAGPGVPARIGITEQATFLVGYHHERSRRSPVKKDASSATDGDSAPDATSGNA